MLEYYGGMREETRMITDIQNGQNNHYPMWERAADSIAEACFAIGDSLSDEQQLILSGSLATWFDHQGKELAQLKAWKESATNVMPDYQAIAEVLGIRLGESIHDKILPAITKLREREMVLVAACEHCLREHGGFTIRGETERIIRAAINATPSQTADQVLRWHVEWMRTLPVSAYGDRLGSHYQQVYCIPEKGMPSWMMPMTELFAIPPLPKESKESPESDQDEALRRQ